MEEIALDTLILLNQIQKIKVPNNIIDETSLTHINDLVDECDTKINNLINRVETMILSIQLKRCRELNT